MNNCPICNSTASINSATFDGIEINCQKCGKFAVSDNLLTYITRKNKIKLRAILRERNLKEHQPITILLEEQETELPLIKTPIVSLEKLLNNFPTQVSERLDRILVNLSKLSDFPGHAIPFLREDIHLFFTETENTMEAFYLMDQLISEKLIEGNVGFPTNIVITAKGWNKIAELERTTTNNNQVFVAMWFNPEVDSIYENAIEKAIKDNGFTPIRIDRVEHNNKIDDEIIANIKKSKFVIADFTGHRGGVYFEAGYAMGRDIPVIWTCRENDLKNLHFDTRQYSHILWNDEKDLYKMLDNRIKATIL
ncbi:hypothetical protein [Rummeliibacillus suwonensis]|uniref:hypothetical protein n=1 Tax=Rummeliibacillus suwonensis TaxID=1306154 RepID=UPI0011B3EB3E|nr:hypothetical protein [Rummeliibacillus suwonensis]